MFLDARKIDDRSMLECDICIVGAGAAGISIARRLIGSGRSICLLESGGLEFDDKTQSLNDAQNVGRDYYELGGTRLRYFGGTTNHWEGFCSSLSSVDLEERPGVPHSGWPIRYKELQPFYRPAQEVCELDPLPLEQEAQWPVPACPACEVIDRSKLSMALFQKSPPTRFGEVYRADIAHADDVRCLLWANLLQLIPADIPNKVDRAEVATLSGKRFTITAKIYVLACGAIENARLLLNSRRITPRGLGNDADVVGRFFMEHTAYTKALRIVPTEVGSTLPLDLEHNLSGRNYLCLQLSPQYLRARGGISMGFMGLSTQSVADATLRTLFRSLEAGHLPDDLPLHLINLMEHRRTTVRLLLKGLLGGKLADKVVSAPPQSVLANVLAEQSPNPDSRLTLDSETDVLGQPQTVLNWQINAQDTLDVRAGIEHLGAEFRRFNLGAVQLLLDQRSEDSHEILGQFHQMGTTRMSSDPKKGVVDSQCRVHGISNLYVAGGSVFPTSGWVNPTLTIVALALRLADHLAREGQ